MKKQKKMTSNQLQETIKKLLTNLGITSGQTILDFGSGDGKYTLSASQLVLPNGKVIAIDKSKQALRTLQKQAKTKNRTNIITHQATKENIIPSNIPSLDVILAFDVLHFLEKDKRIQLYNQFQQHLKTNGRFIIHPKHTKDNWPMWHLSALSTPQLIQEIQQTSFRYKHQKTISLVHDNQIEKGQIIIFTKESKQERQ